MTEVDEWCQVGSEVLLLLLLEIDLQIYRLVANGQLTHKTFINDDGIEVIINTETGESFCSITAVFKWINHSRFAPGCIIEDLYWAAT